MMKKFLTLFAGAAMLASCSNTDNQNPQEMNTDNHYTFDLADGVSRQKVHFFLASLGIGFMSLGIAILTRRPLTCLYIPALLPMIPGMYAYKTVFSLILFVQSVRSSTDHFQYLMAFMSNATITVMVIVVLALGATVPYFIFKRRALSMTRGRAAVSSAR